MSYLVHKDRTPVNTINAIKTLMDDISLFAFERQWYITTKKYCSVRLELEYFPFKGTNGKGISKELALASAYSEMMERLQNGFLIQTYYGLMTDIVIKPHDMKEIELGDFSVEQKDLLGSLISPPVDAAMEVLKEAGPIPCIPFYHVDGKRIVYLPLPILLRNIATNGMCAGNTPEEALCGGICEIFERYVMAQAIRSDMAIPTIPHHVLKEMDAYDLISPLLDIGYNIIVKDCTMGGKYPVLATLILNQNGDRYHINFGSDPIFSVALQRCISESLQGFELGFFDNRLRDVDLGSIAQESEEITAKLKFIDKNIYRQYVNSSAPLCDKFIPSDSYSIDGFLPAFQKTFTSHAKSLKFLTGIVTTNGSQLYVRDVGFLGHPAYQVYIPGMSELRKLSHHELSLIRKNRFVRSCLLNLNRATREDLEACASIMEEIVNEHPFFDVDKRLLVTSILNINLHEEAPFTTIMQNPYHVLWLLFFRIGDYARAYRYFNLFQKDRELTNVNRKFAMCVLIFLKMKARGLPDDHIMKELTGIHGEMYARETFSRFGDPELAFRDIPLPACGDCSACPIRPSCYYPAWKAYAEKMQEKIMAADIDQKNVAALFR